MSDILEQLLENNVLSQNDICVCCGRNYVPEGSMCCIFCILSED